MRFHFQLNRLKETFKSNLNRLELVYTTQDRSVMFTVKQSQEEELEPQLDLPELMETLIMLVLVSEEPVQLITLLLWEPLPTDKLQALEIILVEVKATKLRGHQLKHIVVLRSAVETLFHKTA